MYQIEKNAYLRYFFVMLPILFCLTFSINYFVDPLWYFEGNRVGEKRHMFNKRVSKINYILTHIDNYDCLIFGSSTAASLDGKSIIGHNCFNMGFNFARIEEIIIYAKYLKLAGSNPKLVILGVDQYNFLYLNRNLVVPDFVKFFGSPPPAFETYISYGATRMSVSFLLGEISEGIKKSYRYFFDVKYTSDVPKYTRDKTNNRKRIYSNKHADNLSSYVEFLHIFANAKYVFYIPPVSIYDVELQHQFGILTPFLDSVYSLSRLDVTLIDFSIPSEITSDLTRTPDGYHYNSETNSLVAHVLNGENKNFGVIVENFDLPSYKYEYLSKADYYLAKASEPE